MKKLLPLLFVIFFGCFSSFEFFQGIEMTIPYKIIISQKISKREKKEIETIIREVFDQANTTFNHWNPSSEISRINQSKASCFDCSSLLIELFDLANELVMLSNHRFDPSIGVAIQAWKEALPKGEFIDKNTIDNWKNLIGWDHLSIQTNRVVKTTDDLYFDFDSISKGFVVDTLLKKLKSIGIKHAYVEWGGEIGVMGYNRSGLPWKIGILNPFNESEAIDIIQITDKALATSGNYIQKWRIGNKEYTHLIHGNDLVPLEVSSTNVSSATVIAPTCALADGLATIACLFENSADLECWIQTVKQKNKDIDFIIVYQNNNQ